MDDDDVDHELVSLLKAHLGLGPPDPSLPPDTKVLEHASFIYNNSIDVALDMKGTQRAAESIWKQMQEKSYSTSAWSEHELHPKTKDEATVNFIFTMDLLNFSFWSEKDAEERFSVIYKGKKWTGYWSLVAALQRALDGGLCYQPSTDWNFLLTARRNSHHRSFFLGRQGSAHRGLSSYSLYFSYRGRNSPIP